MNDLHQHDTPNTSAPRPGASLRVRATLRLRNEAILAARARRGLNQARCAQLSEVPLEVLLDLERLRYGRWVPGESPRARRRLEQARRLADFLGLELEDVLPPDLLGVEVDADRAVVAWVPAAALVDCARRTEARLVLPAPGAATESRELVQEALRPLPARLRRAVELRLGLDGADRGRPFREVAAELGVSKGRARELFGAALCRLKRQGAGKRLREHVQEGAA